VPSNLSSSVKTI